MKIFLIIALFLLNLYPAFFDNSYYSASAQNFAYENGSYQIPDIEVVGNAPNEVKCDAYGDSFSDDEAFNHHLRYSCACAIYYGWSPNGDDPNKEKNDDELGFDGQNFCPFCNRPYDYCDCSDIEVSGNRPTSDSWIVIVPNTPPDDEPLVNTDSIGIGDETTPTDTATNHRCQCLVTFSTRARLNAIDKNPRIVDLEDLHYKFAESLKRHIAFPETIQQGNEGTCAAATIQKYLAENFPDDYIDCAINLAETGQYQKWKLKIPNDVYIGAINESILNNANKGHNDYNQKGIDYTSVDYFIQAAIQNWYNDKRRERGYKVPSYNPCLDCGDSIGDGMRFGYPKIRKQSQWQSQLQ